MSDGPGRIDPRRFLGLFLEEAQEHASTIEQGLLRLEDGETDPELIAGVFRAAHSIKGGSGIVGLTSVGRLTHVMESLLERVREGALAPTPALTSALLHATDDLRALLRAVETNGPEPDVTMTVRTLEEALAVGDPSAAPAIESPLEADDGEAREFLVRFRPDPGIFEQGLDPLFVLRDLAAEGDVLSVEIDDSKLPRLSELDPDRCYLAWSIRIRSPRSVAELRAIFDFAEEGSELEIRPVEAVSGETPAPAPARAAAPDEPRGSHHPQVHEGSSIRVAIEKLDKLIDLVGEIVIAQSMISETVSHFTPEKLSVLQREVAEMERTTRELQERVMSVRMVPIGTVFSRFPRVARDTAAALHKQIVVHVNGGETELDKSVIERISDPLMHLVRNAVDHGIEAPADRVRAGKTEHGNLTLSASHQGGNVIILIEDDGRGLDLERIRTKAVAQGLIAADAQPPPEELHALIFRSGFSTAAALTDISGRGVGMDVVKTNIEALSGTISVDSRPGQGTRFRISLPLTLAIIDGLCVGIADEVYVLPLLSIIESFRPRADEVRRLVGRREIVSVRGQALPLLRLRDLFRLGVRREANDSGIVVIIESDGTKAGLVVDEILGQSQVVIKSLDANFRRMDGVMGATILGDGHVALILDVQGLVRIAGGSSGARAGIAEREKERVG